MLAQRSVGEAQPSSVETDAGFVPTPTQASTAAVSNPPWRESLSVRCMSGRRISSGACSSVPAPRQRPACGWVCEPNRAVALVECSQTAINSGVIDLPADSIANAQKPKRTRIRTRVGKRSPAHYLWAVLIDRIYKVFPLPCPKCGGKMRLIAFITAGAQIRKILDHIGADAEPDWDLAAQPAADFDVDQRVNG